MSSMSEHLFLYAWIISVDELMNFAEVCEHKTQNNKIQAQKNHVTETVSG